MADFIIKKLEAANLDQVSRFRMSDAEDKALEIFIRRVARRSGSSALTQTYVAKTEGSPRVHGYISLMCAQIELELEPMPDKADAERYEFRPAVRIARLAVTDEMQGKGLGRQLVEAAIGTALVGIMPMVGCRYLILDAKPKSVAFYKHLGFRVVEGEANSAKQTPLMFMDLKPLADAANGG